MNLLSYRIVVITAKCIFLFLIFFYHLNNIVIAEESSFTPDGKEILKRIYHARTAIHKGDVVINTSTKVSDHKSVEWKWHIRFDGQKIRADIDRFGVSDVICLGCYSKNTRLFYTTALPSVPEGKMALTFYDGDEESSPLHQIPNPKWLGCWTEEFESLYYFEPALTFLNIDKNIIINVVEDDISGQNYWKVSLNQKGENMELFWSCWVDKNVWEKIVRCEHKMIKEGEDFFVAEANFENVCYDGKIWFPYKILSTRYEQKKLTRAAETTLKILSLNKPLQPEVFSLTGIDLLKKDTPVSWNLERDRPYPEGQLIWDGKNIVVMDELGHVKERMSKFHPIQKFLMFLGLSAVFLGVAMKLYKRSH
ncbi:MAG: hypothetical protein LBQ54_00380 [Planctomycetaceae bacterium]|nr:hypothetical protein [Planctomycetaceae bacterium]